MTTSLFDRAAKMAVDLNGHFNSGRLLTDRGWITRHVQTQFLLAEYGRGSKNFFQEVREAKQRGAFHPVGDLLPFRCSQCGESLRIVTDGDTVRLEEPCQYPDGVPPVEVELNVPSGILVVANDLRAGFRIMGCYNVNDVSGQVKTTIKYASVGMVHGFVGNTCPGVFKKDEGADGPDLVIAPTFRRRGYRRAAGVTTDLWWYSVVDADEFARRYGHPPGRAATVDVRPGVYRFSHAYHSLADPDDRKAVYATAEWVRPPDPLRDYKAEWEAMNVTAGQIVHAASRRWYNGRTDVTTLMAIANSIMVVIGSGYELHPNGWVDSSPDTPADEPEVNFPTFNRAYRWYPLYASSYLGLAAGLKDNYHKWPVGSRFNPSFIALAFNIARCIVINGALGDERKETEATARKCLRGLANLYPDQVPANCVATLKKLRK